MLTCYEIDDDACQWTLEPAPVQRDWMNDEQRFPYRCLPLTIANQAGWVLRLPGEFMAYWRGGDSPEDVLIFLQPDSTHLEHVVVTHFGHGVVTFSFPLLFRTEERTQLRVAGLPNWPLFNAHPLEGIVETDWLPFTFTMNWKLVQPHIPVWFRRDDPICFVQPVSLDLIEHTTPQRKRLATNPKLARQYATWADARTAFNAAGHEPGEWQKFYHKGGAGVTPPAHHRTSLKLAEFRS